MSSHFSSSRLFLLPAGGRTGGGRVVARAAAARGGGPLRRPPPPSSSSRVFSAAASASAVAVAVERPLISSACGSRRRIDGRGGGADPPLPSHPRGGSFRPASTSPRWGVVGIFATTTTTPPRRSLSTETTPASSSTTTTTTTGTASSPATEEGESTTPVASPPYFDKVLVANRGEIACRVMRTCERLGVPTVSVHSSVDSRALHARMAGETVCIGPAPSLQSYLDIDAVLDACDRTGATAVHPGYGFLSENAEFGRRAKENGITFIGPPASAIEAMGDKITSKQIAMDAQVSTIPGYDGFISSPEQAVEVANDVGYPVMIKATSGGGGKGMRICRTDEEVMEGYRLSTAEAGKFFDDDRVFIEKYIERPHHIEVQVLAGRRRKKPRAKTIPTINPFPILDEAKPPIEVLCFPERECSIQRRNQKILEESPSVLLKPETRRAMVEQCKRLVQKVGYESAGTVEFLVDEQQNFYFLEMNTRLQVEHPVTEAVTGVDLVELMLMVAAGEGVPRELLEAADATVDGMVPHKGWAMEARIYAEDPLRNFLPSTGPLLQYQEPPPAFFDGNNSVTVRVDSGVTEGSDIGVHYDPMISKLITYADTREVAVEGLLQALDRYVIRGVQHNIPFVYALCRQPDFLRGSTPTDYIPQHFPDGFPGVELTPEEKGKLASVLVVLAGMRREMLLQPPLPLERADDTDDNIGFVSKSVISEGGEDTDETTDASAPPLAFDVFCEHDSTTRSVVALGGMFGRLGTYEVAMNYSTGNALVRPMLDGGDDDGTKAPEGETMRYHLEDVNYDVASPVAEIVVDGKPSAVQVHGESDTGILSVQIHGAALDSMVMTPEEYTFVRYMKPPRIVDMSNMLQSPMPGTLISLAVKEGEDVEIGQELCIVEAMKMQNVLRSPRKGTVGDVRAEVGSSLKADEIILEFAGEEEDEAEK